MPLPNIAPARTMRVFIRDLVLPCSIGIHQHERLAQQRVQINVELTCLEHPAINDDVDNVVCYATAVMGIKAVVADGHINLVETLAERVADVCLADHRVLCAKIRIDKLDVFKEAYSVGVEIERSRAGR
ncbi:dihydroneopterin aldolase [Dongia mobilis]|jgi:dihydroneopterin aldolase|uniref:dihydroneopterin aldolase n=1 Tax=Dongia sp. TaxID=1977262 RepID=UPI0026EDE1AF